MNAPIQASLGDARSMARAHERATLEQLAQALDGRLSLEHAAATLLGPDLRGHMDGFIRDMGITPAGWIGWWRFLWEEGQMREIGCEHLETIWHGEGRYTLIGRWTGVRDGQHHCSEPVEASYVMRDGLVAEVTTSRSNYAFFMPQMQTRLGAVLTLLRFSWWRRER